MSSEVQIAVIDQQDTQIVLAVPGVQGATGSPISPGGTANQVLRKASSTDYDTDWSLVTNAMVDSSAAIAGTKISPNFGSQAVVTTGTSTAASFIPTSNTAPTNGLYLPAANNVAISTNGNGALFIDGNGNVGIGTGSPANYASFVTLALADTSGAEIDFIKGSTVQGSIYNAGDIFYVGGNTSVPTAILAGGSSRLYITSTGELKHIGGGSEGSPGVYFAGSAPSNSLYVQATTGNVGLGTSSPAKKTEIRSAPSTADTDGARIGDGTRYMEIAQTGATYNYMQVGANQNLFYFSGSDLHLSTDGANAITFNTNSLERVRIDSSGRLGIGASSVSELLHIKGGSSTGLDPTILIANGAPATSETASVDFGFNTQAADPDVLGRISSTITNRTTGAQASTLSFSVASAGSLAPRMTLTGTGLGIGSTEPQYLVHAASAVSAGADVGFRMQDTTNSKIIQLMRTGSSFSYIGIENTEGVVYSDNTLTLAADNSNPIKFCAGGGEAARIDSSKRLLVGTPNAESIYYISTVAYTPGVQFKGSGYNPSLSINRTDGGAFAFLTNSEDVTTSGRAFGGISFNGNDGAKYLAGARIAAEADGTTGTDDMPGRLVFSVTEPTNSSPTTSPSAMTINSGQEVLIGYSADNGAYKLQVNSQIFATSATIATSDGRYKENVSTLGGCLDLVKALRPVSFTWKPQQAITRIDDEGEEVVVREPHNFPEGTQVGFIAQEVQEVLNGKPWLGSVIKENVRPAVKDNDGNELAPEEQFYGIAEGNLIAVLTNALQEAVGRIETLEAEIAALKS